MSDYERTVKLKHNETLQKTNVETGEISDVPYRPNNFKKGQSKLKYKHFGILNTELSSKLEKYFSNTEMAIIFKMINRCEFQTNSLRPLSNSTTVRELADTFKISKNSTNKIFSKLFKMGVYAQMKISENNYTNEYWILNPFIFWRGSVKNDSIFNHFENTDIAKLFK